jgi:hypothetical protein
MIMATKTVKKRDSKSAVRYIINDKGEKTEVVLPIELYEALLERIEDAEDIQAIKEAMKEPDFIPWEEAKKQLGV